MHPHLRLFIIYLLSFGCCAFSPIHAEQFEAFNLPDSEHRILIVKRQDARRTNQSEALEMILAKSLQSRIDGDTVHITLTNVIICISNAGLDPQPPAQSVVAVDVLEFAYPKSSDIIVNNRQRKLIEFLDEFKSRSDHKSTTVK